MCTHTPCCRHIFLTQYLCVAYRHRVHAWLKAFNSAHVRSCHLTLSILIFQPPFPSAPSSPNCARTESVGQAHVRTSAEEFGYLAESTHSQDEKQQGSVRRSFYDVCKCVSTRGNREGECPRRRKWTGRHNEWSEETVRCACCSRATAFA